MAKITITFLNGRTPLETDTADLRKADLRKADLRKADLRGADLREADLREADLRWADLRWADLRWADLRWADLRKADLRWADLCEANLSGADLRKADLSGADLRKADLREADLRGADLGGAKLPAFQIVPEKGAFTAYKKLKNWVVAEIEIPAEAARTSSLVGRKCRAEFVRVMALSEGKSGKGLHDGTVYKVGEIVRADKWDDDIRVECTHGIHFFVTRKEAEDYN